MTLTGATLSDVQAYILAVFSVLFNSEMIDQQVDGLWSHFFHETVFEQLLIDHSQQLEQPVLQIQTHNLNLLEEHNI